MGEGDIIIEQLWKRTRVKRKQTIETYIVLLYVPMTFYFIADRWLIYVFKCYTNLKRNLNLTGKESLD